jgi:type IV pilus assembly protein PilM
MSIFSKKTMGYLGVDIGSSTVKIVELAKEDGKPRLKNYAFAEKHEFLVKQDKSDDVVGEASVLIKKVYESAEFASKKVVAALHNFDVFTSVINLPQTNSQAMENVVKVEARKFVPIPLEDVILDWKALDQSNKNLNKGGKTTAKNLDKDMVLTEQSGGAARNAQAGGIDILLTAAPRKLVSKYLNIFQEAHLDLLSLETESFALIRSLLDRSELSSLMLIDIGAVATDIIIVEQQIPVVIRTVDAGGAAITSAIEQSLGINRERAEQFKRDIGIFSNAKERQTDSVAQIIESAFAPVINEVNYSIDLYKTRNKSIEKIILSGGSAYLTGLVDFLKSTFDLPVHIGDPWYKVDYPKPLKATLKELGPVFAIAAGLALKEIVE